jgi:hypothetical protein
LAVISTTIRKSPQRNDSTGGLGGLLVLSTRQSRSTAGPGAADVACAGGATCAGAGIGAQAVPIQRLKAEHEAAR